MSADFGTRLPLRGPPRPGVAREVPPAGRPPDPPDDRAGVDGARPPARRLATRSARPRRGCARSSTRRAPARCRAWCGPASTFADACAECLRYMEHDLDRKPSTLRDYRSTIRAHLVPAFGELRLEDVTSRADRGVEGDAAASATAPRSSSLTVLNGVFVARPARLQAAAQPGGRRREAAAAVARRRSRSSRPRRSGRSCARRPPSRTPRSSSRRRSPACAAASCRAALARRRLRRARACASAARSPAAA